jgi:oligosaccharide repeat unit polymerase
MIWLVLGWLLLVCVTLLTYKVEQSLIAPAVLFPLIWSTAFLFICLAGDFFNPISLKTMEVYIIGAGCFIVTSVTRQARRTPTTRPDENRLHFVRVVVLVSVVSLCALLPAYFDYAQNLAATAGGGNFWVRLRTASIGIVDTPGGGPFSFLANLPVLALAVALCATRLRTHDGCSKTLELAAVCVGLAYQVLTGARSYVFVLLVCIVVLRLTGGRTNMVRTLRIAFILGVLFASLFVANQIMLNKGVDKRYNSLGDNVILVAKEALVHAVGGLVGFDQIVADPDVILHSHDIAYFFIHTLNKLGAQLPELSRHAENLQVAPGYYTNVFTQYFCYYPRYGLLGTIIIMLCLGGFAKACYVSCKSGSDLGAILFALTVHGILISTIADEFFLTLNTWLKCALFVSLAFHWPVRLRSRLRQRGLVWTRSAVGLKPRIAPMAARTGRFS